MANVIAFPPATIDSTPAGGSVARVKQTAKLLVIEDDPKIGCALTARLTAAGYAVIAAATAFAAINAALEHAPDLLIVDIDIPHGSGFAVVRRVRRMAAKLGVPFIFITTGCKPGLRKQAAALGAAGYLEKPFEAAKLLQAVARALARD